ncbi:ribonuclease Z [Desulfosarcina ovata subsp. sediminis]|uniref:Ribonuclease Z n=1 Tax=Desulfosarcina ovata subsp. sediminis TaxID=885957 RepID=A0A5K7ZBM3_9BACT|nr:MBL fold metallo-hydrolase [Desulfosarcina ovata]BBO79568.1 ribonuclease Z [Desulfosarcina ovata subsp. sediminis]
MGPSFLPRLVNGPFDDPALFVQFRHRNRAILFDLGDVAALASRDILKITHIFVTHTHMDHFTGFDRILRLMLGRDKELVLVGPQGFLSNLSGKLSAYCWNLVENYTNRFILHAIELHPDRARCCCYPCHKGFRPDGEIRETPFDGTVLSEGGLTVNAVHLDHGTPVLAFALHERFHIHILKTALDRLGIAPGPWLNRLKTLLYESADPQTVVEIPGPPSGKPRHLKLGELTDSIVRISPGVHIAYVADIAGSPANLQKVIALAEGVDHLFVEAAFADRHREIARRKHHLTAGQAGALARSCGAKQYHLFHFSPRYTDCPEILEAEALAAFQGHHATSTQG